MKGSWCSASLQPRVLCEHSKDLVSVVVSQSTDAADTVQAARTAVRSNSTPDRVLNPAPSSLNHRSQTLQPSNRPPELEAKVPGS